MTIRSKLRLATNLTHVFANLLLRQSLLNRRRLQEEAQLLLVG